MTFVRDRLADLVLGIRYTDLAPEVVHETKRLIIDTMACALAGFASEPSKSVRKTVHALGGSAQSTIIGENNRTSCTWATLANGTMMRYQDSNDYYIGRDPSHPSGNLAAALAVAESLGLGGKDVILAMVAAYEVQVRLCDFAGKPNIWERGWHHCTNMQFSSAALAAKLLGLDRDATANAIAIAGSQNNTLAQAQRGTIPLMKATAEAAVAKGGVEAALLAMNGLTGPEEIFEGHLGWGRCVAGEVDFESLTLPLAGHYRIMDACMKPYAAEAMMHGHIEAAIELAREHNLTPSQVKHVEARFPEYPLRKPSWNPEKLKPINRETADHSFPFCIAVAFTEGDCGPEQFVDEKFNSPVIRGLMERMTLVVDPELTALWPASSGGALVITTHSGERFEKIYKYPPGNPKNRLSDKRVEGKVRRFGRGLLIEAQMERVIDRMWHLDECDDLSEFMGEFVI